MAIKDLNTKKELEEKMELYKNRVIYSLPARSGQWANELAIREQNEFLYAYRKDHCQLLIQKTRKMFRNISKPITLAEETPYIQYNLIYQIKSYGITETLPCGREVTHPLYLSGVISEREIDSTQHFTHGCAITASPSKLPCVRNSFRIASCGAASQGSVNYGEDVFFQIVESDDLPLYVQCENTTMDTFGSHLHLRLSQSPDIYCRFKILHWKPQLRLETNGTYIPYNSFVIIKHTASGHNLAAEFHSWLPTFFGAECTVSAHTFQDTHRMETAENFWKIMGAQKTKLGAIEIAKKT